MFPDPGSLPQKAKAREDENYTFRHFLKHQTKLASEQVDKQVFELEAKVWKRIDCTKCANCCRVISPVLSEEDVTRLASHLGITSAEFVAKYLAPSKDEPDFPWIMREKPCPFLKDNRCSVYEHRPQAFRGYPYLNKDKFVFRTLGMIERLSECPAVFEVWEELKSATGFRYRGR
ncbi:MAG: zinc/iron-chelating domain-containing protein [Verrucomicrobia bacterium]|nr:MAG: zinc/iron-chelating domain-containing protein [Verrucomicrobiota bacterium]